MIVSEPPMLVGQTAIQTSIPSNISGGHTPLFDLLFQLEAALQNAHDDDLAPAQRAISRAAVLLVETLPHLPEGGDLYRDGDGGLRVEWTQAQRQIRLVIHASEEREDYLYWQEGSSHFIETPVNASLLAKWQNWLLESIK